MGGFQLRYVYVLVAGMGYVVRAGAEDDHPVLRNVDQVLGVAAGEIADGDCQLAAARRRWPRRPARAAGRGRLETSC